MDGQLSGTVAAGTRVKKVIRRIGTRFSRSQKSFDPIIDAISTYSMCDLDALKLISRLASYVNSSGIEGDLVECGVCNGGSAALIASRMAGRNLNLWLYDSFEGLPPTNDVDGDDARRWIGKCVGTKEQVLNALAIVNFPLDKVIIKEGWFEQTFEDPTPEKICFLHIDADWYASVSLCLETFYDSVSPGGVILLDDFGYWEGCREAFYDFCASKGIKPVLERAGSSQAFWIKGQLHNRGSRVAMPAGDSAENYAEPG